MHLSRAIRAAAVAAAVAGAAAPRGAAAPPELSAGPPFTGGVLAAPSVYAVTAQDPRTGDTTRGLAFAVAPGGYLVTALHVVEPGREGAPARVTVRQLTAARGARARSWPARLARTERDLDLALLRIPARGLPGLTLGAQAAPGDPVMVFRNAGGAVAAEATRAGPTQLFGGRFQRELTRLATPAAPGRSGGPVVDADGRVRGVVLATTGDDGFAEPPASVERLLRSARVTAREGPAGAAFRAGVDAILELAPRAARRELRAARTAFPAHTFVARELDVADAVEEATYRVVPERRTPAALLAAGFAAAAVAAAFLVALGAGAGSHRNPPRPGR